MSSPSPVAPRSNPFWSLLVGVGKFINFVNTLVSFARSSPDKILNKAVPVINYNPYLGIRNFNKAISLIKERAAG